MLHRPRIRTRQIDADGGIGAGVAEAVAGVHGDAAGEQRHHQLLRARAGPGHVDRAREPALRPHDQPDARHALERPLQVCQVGGDRPLRSRQVRLIGERRERPVLRDQVRVQPGQPGLQLEAAADETGRSGEEPDPRPRHPIAVRHRHRRDRAVGQAERRQRLKPRGTRVERDRGVGDVVDQQQAMAVGQLGERGQLVARLDRPVRVERVDDGDRARAGRDRAGHVVGIEPEPGGRRDRHRHGHAAGGEHRRGDVEVARVGHDHLVARVDRRHQRERDRGLGTLGADNLEPRVAAATERQGGGVAQRLDQVGGVLVERLGGDRGAHRPDRRSRRAAEAGQPPEVRPLGRIQTGGALRVDRGGVEAEQRDRVSVGHIVPHAVVAGADRVAAALRPAGRRASPPRSR